jgi:hypothetical protein
VYTLGNKDEQDDEDVVLSMQPNPAFYDLSISPSVPQEGDCRETRGRRDSHSRQAGLVGAGGVGEAVRVGWPEGAGNYSELS